MTGDNRLHLGVICRQSVEEADFVWAVCVRDCTGLWIGSAYLPGALGGPALAMKSPWERAQGLLVRSGTDFRAVDGRRTVRI